MAGLTLSNVWKKFGPVVAVKALDLEIKDREFVSFLGPSGCGKTTTLNMIAGLETASDGQILMDGKDITQIPPRLRNFAMVFQGYALYPHMTVADNIGFALRVRNLEKSEIDKRVAHAAEKLELKEVLGRYPRQLSGGQRQRVALGRAFVRDPHVFLLDEPLSNLDAVLRVQTRIELKRLFDDLDTTAIYVTHDQAEAMTMSDRIAIFRHGMLQQFATPLEIYRNPTNKFVATFVGNPPMSISAAVLTDSRSLQALGSRMAIPERILAKLKTGTTYDLGLRAEDLEIVEKDGASMRVDVVEHLGSATILHLMSPEGRLIVQSAPTEPAKRGDPCSVKIDPARLYLFDQQSGEAIVTPGLLA